MSDLGQKAWERGVPAATLPLSAWAPGELNGKRQSLAQCPALIQLPLQHVREFQGCPHAALPKVGATFHTKGLIFTRSYRMFSYELKFPSSLVLWAEPPGPSTELIPNNSLLLPTHCHLSFNSDFLKNFLSTFLFVFKEM